MTGQDRSRGDAAEDAERGPPPGAVLDAMDDGLATVDTEGVVVAANERLAELTGTDRAALVGRRMGDLVADRSRADHEAAHRRCLAGTDRVDPLALVLDGADGPLPVEVSFGRVDGADGTHVVETVRPTDDPEPHRDLARTFEALFEQANSFAAVLDASGRIERLNRAALELAGGDPSAVVGRRLWEAPWWDDWAVLSPSAPVRELVGRTADGNHVAFEAEYRSDGERIVLDAAMEPVHDDDGDVDGIVVVGRDVTETTTVTETLRRQGTALQDLYEVLADPELDHDQQLRRVLELGCAYLDLPYGFLTDIDDDTQRVVAVEGDHEALSEGSSAPLSEAYCRRTIESDDLVSLADAEDTLGPTHPAFERFGLGCYVGGKVVVDGDLFGTLCFAGDASRERSFSEQEQTFVRLLVEWLGRDLERQRYQRDLEATRDRLERTFERIEDGFLAVDDGWAVTYVNEAGARTLKQSMRADDAGPVPEDLVGTHLWDAVPATAGTRFETEFRRAMDTQEPTTFEAYFEPVDRWFEVRAYPASDGLSVHFTDASERRRRERMLAGLLETTREMTGADTPEEVARMAVDAATDLLDQPLNAVRLYDEDTGRLEVVATSNPQELGIPERPVYEPDEGNVGEAFQRGESLLVEDVEGAGPVTTALYLPMGEAGVLTLAATEADAFDESDRRLGELLAESAAAAIERAARETTLRQYEAVVENVRGMVYAVDEQGHITMATKPLAAALGYDHESLQGMDATDLFDEDGAADHEAATGVLSSGYATSQTFEATCRTADGDPLPVEVELGRLSGDGHGGFVGVITDISDLAATRTELTSQSDRFKHLFEYIPDPVNEVEFVDGEPIVRSVNPAFEETFGYSEAAVRGENLEDYIVPEDRADAARSVNDRAVEEGVVVEEVRRRTVDGLRTFLFRGISYEVDGRTFGFGTYADITEQKERQRRLEVLHTVLRHNLRTEMTVMRGYADQLDEALEGDLPALAGIVDGIESVGDLSSKVRDLERAVGHADHGAVEPVDVVPLVRRAVEQAAVDHPDADVDADLPAAATAVADDRLTLAVQHLLDNAVDHSDRDRPSVTVTLGRDDDWVTLRVADDGPGIPEAEQALVSGDQDITQLEHGSGLGLWLVSWVVRAYGGKLAFEDRDPRGQVVVVHLPAE